MSDAALASRLSEHAAAIADLRDSDTQHHRNYAKVLSALADLREDVQQVSAGVSRLEATMSLAERPSGTLIIQQQPPPRSERPGLRGAILDKIIIAGLCSGFWVIAELLKALAHAHGH